MHDGARGRKPGVVRAELTWREHGLSKKKQRFSSGFLCEILVLDFGPKNICLFKLHSMNKIKHIISKISPAGYQFAPSAEKV